MEQLLKDKVSILLPTFNSEKYLNHTLQSIIKQNYKNFELIIIDNFSTDKTMSIINNYLSKNLDIKIFKFRSNNLAKALNFGINNAIGEFILRIDSDDLIRGKRIDKQVKFLNRNKDYHIVGTNALRFERYKFIIKPFLINYNDIDLKLSMLFNSPFIHPTIMFRSSFVRENKILYDENYNECEDYNLWYKIMDLTKFKNLSYFGIFYRVHQSSASFKKKDKLEKYFKITNNKIINKYGLNFSQSELICLRKISKLEIKYQDNFDYYNKTYITILKKIDSKLNKFYPEFEIKNFIKKKYLRFCLRSIKSKNFKPRKIKNNYFNISYIDYIIINLFFFFKIRL